MNPTLIPFYWALPIQAQNLALSVVGFQKYWERFSAHFFHTIEKLEDTIDDPLERHYERQWSMLQALMSRAREHVPYYKFLPEPIDEGDPQRSIEATLAQLPVLEKCVYRARSRDFVATDVPSRRLVKTSTSGSTGTPLPVWYTPEHIAEYYAIVWRQRRSFGVQLNDPFISMKGHMIAPLSQRQPPFWRTDHYCRETLFSVHHLSPATFDAYVDAVHDTPAHYVEGYPSALHLVGRAMLDRGKPLEPGRLKAVFPTSESVLAFQRETIEAAFGAPVRDHYASTERVVSMTSCTENRLHVDMEFGIVEVEPQEETDEYVRGPLIVTGLPYYACPLIRYRIGDVGAMSKSPCPCGRPGNVFLDIDGRIEDYVLTPSGTLVGRLDHVLKGQYDVAEAQIVQKDPSRLDVYLVPAPGYDDTSKDRLIRSFQQRLGRSMDVVIHPVDDIPREPNGKFRAVKSELPEARR